MNTRTLLASSLLIVLSACQGKCSCGADDGEDGDSSSSVGGGGQGGDTSAPTTVGSGGETGAGGAGDGGSGVGGSGVGGEGGGAAGGVSLRFAHLSPDSGAFDICLRDAESADAPYPLFGGEGIAFKDITEHGSVHSGAYSVILVAAGAESCGTPLFETEPVDLDFGDVQTIAIIGRADAAEGDAEALGIAFYPDDLTPPAEGEVRARFIHAAPGAPSVDIGYLDEGGAFVGIWEATSYPNDAGYVDLPAFESLELVAIVAGTGDDPNPLLTHEIQGPEGTIVEGFAVGLAAGAGAEVITTTTIFGE